MKNNQILEFAKIISGIFSNKEQALEDPRRFPHIQIHIRPLFMKTFNCYAFYSEQRYQHDIWNPYRQSINKLSQEKEIFILSNHKIENKERLVGGAINTSRLDELSQNKLYKSSGCSMHFLESSPGNFSGNIEPGERCYLQKDNKITYIKSQVELTKDILISEDSGYEKITNKKIWGSDYGPLVFKKIQIFDEFIESNWR